MCISKGEATGGVGYQRKRGSPGHTAEDFVCACGSMCMHACIQVRSVPARLGLQASGAYYVHVLVTEETETGASYEVDQVFKPSY